jgi:hypothetical protein
MISVFSSKCEPINTKKQYCLFKKIRFIVHNVHLFVISGYGLDNPSRSVLYQTSQIENKTLVLSVLMAVGCGVV